MKQKAEGIKTLIVGFLTSTMGLLAALNVEYQWLTGESIQAFGVWIVALIMLIGGLIATWKNTFVSKKGRKQNEYLKQRGLK